MNFRYENKKHKQGFAYIIGCDEVGRGSLAGPVVAAAVVLPMTAADDKSKVESYKVIKSCGIKDSKLLTPARREELSEIIKRHAIWGIGVVDEKIIDKINIHRATLAAMKLAVENLLSSLSVSIPSECSRVEESVNDASLQNRSLRSSSDAFGLGRDETGGTLIAIDGKFTIPSFAEATEGKPNFNNMEQEAVIDGDNKILSIAAASIIAKVYRDDLMRKLHRKYPIYNFWQHKGYGTLLHRIMILQNGLSPIHRKSFCNRLLLT
jgi:ribonuclease HII